MEQNSADVEPVAAPILPIRVTDLGKITTNKKVVVSIDFGTTYSGVGIAYRDSPERVNCGAPGALASRREIKVPTVLLRKTRTGEFLFGNTALEHYQDATVLMDSTNENSDWEMLPDHTRMGVTHSTHGPLGIARCFVLHAFSRAPMRVLPPVRENVVLFRNFKMELKNKTSGFDTLTAKSECGSAEHSLMDLVAQALKFLSNYALEEIKSGYGACLSIDKTRDVQWVVTVPAIWNDFGKQFMRKAAMHAGMVESETSQNLVLALEPESAAFAVNAEATGMGLFKEGTCFMVLDAGGGTVDITVHRVATQTPLVLDEVAAPTGGNWGGMYVDKEFEGLLLKLIGKTKFEQLQSKYPNEVSSVISEFRAAKENYSPDSGTFVRVSLADIFNDDVCNDLGIPPLEEAVKDFNKAGEGFPFDLGNSRVLKMMRRQSVVSFNDNQMKAFFGKTMSKICEAVAGVFERHEDCRTVVIVGGYGSSRVLRSRIQSEFECEPFRAQVFVPDAAIQPQAAIMHGAALYGLCTSVIRSRIAKYTYGVGGVRRWFRGVDPPGGREVAFEVDGVPYLNNCFSTICTKGSSISPCDKHECGYNPLRRKKAREVKISIFKSREKDPRWIDEDGCEKLGEICVPLLYVENKAVRVECTFTTELVVEVVRDDGERFRTSVRME